MKLQSMVILILATGLLFVLVGGIVTEFNTYYPEANVTMGDIDPETGSSKYDVHAMVMGNLTDISGQLEQIKTGNVWQKILGGFQVFATGVLSTIVMIITLPITVILFISMLTADLGAPAIVSTTIIPIFLAMLLAATIIMIAKFLHGGSVGV